MQKLQIIQLFEGDFNGALKYIMGRKLMHHITDSKSVDGDVYGSRVGKKDFGFIAQELLAAGNATDYANHMRLVSEENPDKLEADPMKMFPILVKAIQELSTKNDALVARITALEG